ncbi:inositol monophosphatase family protein [Roseomonas sp. OT10]|uniref:inositol monophosphatase family protein n=1 Tax=Roseomonas cutis TaxID=2897332 RepID=UPI001E489459|nr:inositol monophosphatase family protein [Roseomonas sp. OT10]UFN48154.1 inositol monophosphatase family protein [Roseomonas sp. OT10]
MTGPAAALPAGLLSGMRAIAAEAAGTLVRMQGSLRAVRRKELNDVVTEADLASEALVLRGLGALTPDAAILSEEAGASGDLSGASWIVDPLDGTVNYAAGLPWFSVTMAYRQDGRLRAGIVHAPLVPLVASWSEAEGALVDGRAAAVSPVRELADAVVSVCLTSHFSAGEVERTAAAIRLLGERARGVRVIVSGGLEMSLVAAGRLEAFVSFKADAVSHAAGMALVRAAGGRVTRLDGSEADDESLERVASNGAVHEELLELLSRV